MYLYGRRAVQERLKANPGSIRRIYLQAEKLAEIAEAARQRRIPISGPGLRQFPGLARDAATQGVVAEVDPFQYADFYEQLKQPDEAKPVFLFLDRITDPRNLGAIMRNCACFGGFCIVLPKHRSAEVNETVLKVACGAENYVPVVMVTNLVQAVAETRKEGWWIGAAVVQGGVSLREAKLNFPLGIILGSEEEGIRAGLLKCVDLKLTLPMPGAPLSFNAGVAAGLLCYEITLQRPKNPDSAL